VSGAPLHIGVIGLGDIATKAYLPVLTARPDLRLTLMSRDSARVDRVARQYGLDRAVTALDDLLADGVRVAFVHAATEAHAELVERLLLADVHVLVDKPLAPDLAECRRLVELAEQRRLSLAVGFNRRYAPAYAALAGLPRSVVLMQKNRVGLPDEPRRLVFDDFIHVVDTLRFLLPAEEERVDVRCWVADGLLHTVTVGLHAGDVSGFGVMHRVSGGEEEVLEVLGNGHKHRVLDAADLERYDATDRGGLRTTRRGSWTPVPVQRGFAAMCDAFLDAVRGGEILSARDALRTHELCETVVQVAESSLREGAG
jgi:virulence factor